METLLITLLICGGIAVALTGIAYKKASKKHKPQFVWIMPLVYAFTITVVLRIFGYPWLPTLLAAVAIALTGLQVYRVVSKLP